MIYLGRVAAIALPLALIAAVSHAAETATTTSQTYSSQTTTATTPPSNTGEHNVLEAARRSGQFNTFIKAVNAAGLQGSLEGSGPYTLYAPTDAAFQKLGAAKVQNLMQPENRAELTRILQNHVVPNASPATMSAKESGLRTLSGQPITVERAGTTTRVENANATTPEIPARNGTIVGIDTVLVPASVPMMTTPGTTSRSSTTTSTTSTTTTPAR